MFSKFCSVKTQEHDLAVLYWHSEKCNKDESHRSQKSLPSGRSSWTIGTGWSPSLLLQCLCPPAPPPEHQAPTGLMAAAAKSLQSCPTLCDPRDGSPPGSSVHGIFQARVLESGDIAFSGAHG